MPSRKPASVTVRPGRRPRAAERREADVEEELAGAGVLEHGAVDREQDDVGRRDVERDAEDALGAHDERRRQPRQVVAAVADEPAVRDEVAVHGVGDEQHAHDRQDRPDGPPGRDEDQRDEQHPADDVDDERREAARDVGVEAGEQRPRRRRTATPPPAPSRAATAARRARRAAPAAPAGRARTSSAARPRGRRCGTAAPAPARRRSRPRTATAGPRPRSSPVARRPVRTRAGFSASASTGTSSSDPQPAAAHASVGAGRSATLRLLPVVPDVQWRDLARDAATASTAAAGGPRVRRSGGSAELHGAERAAARRLRDGAQALRALPRRARRLGLGREAVHEPLHRPHDDDVDDRGR